MRECQSQAQPLQDEKTTLEEALLDREMELRDLDSLVKDLECQLSEERTGSWKVLWKRQPALRKKSQAADLDSEMYPG